MTKTITITEATKQWVGEMNTIPQSLLDKAYPSMEEDGLNDLTPIPMKWECDTCDEEFSQEEIDKLEGDGHEDNFGNIVCPTCFVICKEEHEERDAESEFTLDDCNCTIEKVEDYEKQEYGLPMWGWLWNPSSTLDEEWIKDNLKIVAECGFRIFESDEVGVLIGIDGAGYDFYEAHWIPLYKARGLKWHNTEEVG